MGKTIVFYTPEHEKELMSIWKGSYNSTKERRDALQTFAGKTNRNLNNVIAKCYALEKKKHIEKAERKLNKNITSASSNPNTVPVGMSKGEINIPLRSVNIVQNDDGSWMFNGKF